MPTAVTSDEQRSEKKVMRNLNDYSFATDCGPATLFFHTRVKNFNSTPGFERTLILFQNLGAY
jgi:hypothetical protein